MRTTLIASLITSALFVAQAHAADVPAADYTFTGNVAVTSDYLFRGITQTNNKAAIQGGFDFAHKSGFYAGAWGSSISWLSDQGSGSYPTELDVYTGYKGNIVDDLGYDIGVLTYYYPGTRNPGVTSPNTTELYGAISYQWATFKYSRSTGNLFGWTSKTGDNTHGSSYYDLTLAPSLGDGWTVSGHIGRQTVAHRSSASYNDWRLGVSKDVGFGTLSLNYTDTNAEGDIGQDYRNAFNKDIGRGRVAVTFSKTL
ncbi:TorF family putative porin [Chitinimonas naiadis]